MSQRTRVLVAALVVVAALITACETGLVELSVQRAVSTSTITKQIQGREKLAASDVRIEYVNGAEHHVHAISQGSQQRIDVTATVTRYELTGPTWTPLFKRARLEYEVTIRSSDPEVTGSISGTIEKKGRGIQSTRGFRAGFREEVREVVLETLGE
jgi:hypothetical protein